MQTIHQSFSKIIFVFVWCCMSFALAVAQESPIQIINSGELLSTYNLAGAENEKAEIRKQVGEKLLQDIINNSQESNWPQGISTLDARNSNRPRINEYVAYKVASFGSDGQFVVLRIPASQNQFQPYNLIPKRDIYFIIGKSGVEAKSGKPYMPTETPVATEEQTNSGSEEMQQIRITNPMELYSTYNLLNDDAARALLVESGELTEEDFGVLAEMANEKSWPEGINTYANREENRAKIKDYKAYMALDYESKNKKLMMIYIPQSENDFMPSNMRPKTEMGFYMILNRNGVEYMNGDDDAPVPLKPKLANKAEDGFVPSVSISSAYSFSDQLNVLVEGLHNNFEDLRGAEVKEDFLLGKKFQSLLNLTGAEETYIYEALLSSEVEGATMIAVFPDYRNLDEGVAAYKELVSRVADTKFPCCTLVQNEQEDETLRTTYWLPFDITGKMHASMNKMVVEVQLMKTLGIDKETFKTYDNYSLVLRTYKQK